MCGRAKEVGSGEPFSPHGPSYITKVSPSSRTRAFRSLWFSSEPSPVYASVLSLTLPSIFYLAFHPLTISVCLSFSFSQFKSYPPPSLSLLNPSTFSLAPVLPSRCPNSREMKPQLPSSLSLSSPPRRLAVAESRESPLGPWIAARARRAQG